MRRFLLGLTLVALFAACSKTEEPTTSRSVNIRLSFTPSKISADDGSTVMSVAVDDFSGNKVQTGDLRITTSAGNDKVGAITAQGNNRFEVALQGLTDLSWSPVEIVVDVGGTKEQAEIEIVSGAGRNVDLQLSSKTVSADDGFVTLTVAVQDDAGNATEGALQLDTSAGVLTGLRRGDDGLYQATVTGLTDTDDSPVLISARVNDEEAQASVQILAGVLHHYDIAPIAGPQQVNQPFNVEAGARDRNGNLVTAFNGLVPTVRTSRGGNDIDPAFTMQFVMGELTQSFRINTESAGLTVQLVDAQERTGESNVFVVDPTPATRMTLRSAADYNLIVNADGCVRPNVSKPETQCVDPMQASRIEMLLEAVGEDEVVNLVGGKGAEVVVSMTDGNGVEYSKVYPNCDGEPCMGVVEDNLDGYYYLNVFNLHSQPDSPYTVRFRYASIVEEIEVSVVPGRVDHISFSPVPAQRSNPENAGIATFNLTATARDFSGNQVFSFQDSLALYQEDPWTGARVKLMQTPPMTLGTTNFLVTLQDLPGMEGPTTDVTLAASHNALEDSYSNTFKVIQPVSKGNPLSIPPYTTPYIDQWQVYLPGQYAPVPKLDDSPTGTPTSQTVGEPFEILIFPRSSTPSLTNSPAFIGVTGFDGRALIGGNGIEVIDDSCEQDGNLADNPAPTQLTPPFIDAVLPGGGTYSMEVDIPFVGTVSQPQPESHCYVTVRATVASNNANLTVNGVASSSTAYGTGAISTNFQVKQAMAVGLAVEPIPNPKLATLNSSAKQYTTIRVRAVDAFGNTTNNVTCPNLVLTDTGGYLRQDASWSFTEGQAVAQGQVWWDVENPPVSTVVTADCGGSLRADSNAVKIISQGVNRFEIQILEDLDGRVRAGEDFRFSAVACADMACNPAADFVYRATVTDSSGTLTPGTTEPFDNGNLVQTARIDTAGETQVCIAGAGVLSCSDPFTVEIGQLSHFRIAAPSFGSEAFVGDPYALTVTAVDAGGNAITNYKVPGLLYISDAHGTVSWVKNDTLLSAARVTSTAAAVLHYCSDQDASPATETCIDSGIPLTARFTEMGGGNYLMVHDGRGHSGFSLPQTFKVAYGPLTDIEFTGEPCPASLPTMVREEAFFNLCATARDGYGNLKKDYSSTQSVLLWDPFGNDLAPTLIDFSNGVAREQVQFTYGAGTPSQLAFKVDAGLGGGYYPESLPMSTRATAATPVVTLDTTTHQLPTEVRTTDEFVLDFEQLNGGAVDTYFFGSLRVTDATGSIEPVCVDEQIDCGFAVADLDDPYVVTGAFNLGKRRQGFRIPMEWTNNYLYVTDGYGNQVTFGPIQVVGSLDHFDVSITPELVGPPAKVATGRDFNITIVARDSDGNEVTGFNGYVELSHVGAGNIVPTQLTGFTGGVLNRSVQIDAPGASLNRITVTHMLTGATGESQEFYVETPAFTSLTWETVPTAVPGYVDVDGYELRTWDQFGQAFFYGGTLNFTSSAGGYAVRPGTSDLGASGVFTQALAIDGVAGGTTTLTATADGKTATTPTINVQASTVASFSVYAEPVTNVFVVGCPYDLKIEARSNAGLLVTDYSGPASLRLTTNNVCPQGFWCQRTDNIEVLGQPSESKTVTPNFEDGVAEFQVKFTEVSNHTYLYGYIPNTGIEGNITEVQLTSGTCPAP